MGRTGPVEPMTLVTLYFRAYVAVAYITVPTDDPVRSRPMPPGYAHEPLDAGTRARPVLAVGVLLG